MKILCVGDTHFPFAKGTYITKMVQWAKENQPDVIIQIGDLYDNYAFSRYTKTVNLMTPEQELNRGRKVAEKMWADLKKAAPKAQCYQMMGNHCARIIKRVLEKLPALSMKVKMKDQVQSLHNIDKLFEFRGVTSVLDYRAEVKLHGILFVHGFKGNIGEHVKYFHKSVVTGHLHRGGVAFMKVADKVLWELNCGFLGDAKALPFQYGETKTSRWTPGFGVIEKECGTWVPRFIAF